MGVEIANSGKRILFYSIDLWRGTRSDAAHGADEDVRNGSLWEAFVRNTHAVAGFVRPVMCDSAEAAGRFDDESVDFLYIDAEHTFAAVSRELRAWWPKVKRGGTIAGDDWCSTEAGGRLGVREAVAGFAETQGMQPLVVAGNPHPDWEQWVMKKPA